MFLKDWITHKFVMIRMMLIKSRTLNTNIEKSYTLNGGWERLCKGSWQKTSWGGGGGMPNKENAYPPFFTNKPLNPPLPHFWALATISPQTRNFWIFLAHPYIFSRNIQPKKANIRLSTPQIGVHFLTFCCILPPKN